MANLDRFARGLPDPQQKEVKVVRCESCGYEIPFGYEAVRLNDGNYVCDNSCLRELYEAEWAYVGE